MRVSALRLKALPSEGEDWLCRAHTAADVRESWDTSPIHSLYRTGLTTQAQSFLLRRNVHRNVTHPIHSQTPQEVSEVP